MNMNKCDTVQTGRNVNSREIVELESNDKEKKNEKMTNFQHDLIIKYIFVIGFFVLFCLQKFPFLKKKSHSISVRIQILCAITQIFIQQTQYKMLSTTISCHESLCVQKIL